VRSFILIHPTVWPQYTDVTDRSTGQTGERSDSIGRTVLQTAAQMLRGVPDMGCAVCEALLSKTSSHSRNVEQVTAVGPLFSRRPVRLE